MKKEKYDMLLGDKGCGRGPEVWIIYPKDGNYIYDKVCELPGGSEIQRIKALEVLNAMNS